MSGKICVIDDDPAICNLLKTLLSNDGYEVMTINKPLFSDKELVQFKPDLVVLDITMPWLTGDSIADILGYTFPTKPKVVFFSSKPLEELAALAKEKEVDGFVSKSEGSKALRLLLRVLLPSPQPPAAAGKGAGSRAGV